MLKFPNILEPSSKLILSSKTAIKFTDLFDTFDSYVGKGGYYLKVMETEDGIEVSAISLESDKNYIHEQTTSATQWIVIHNLNKFPAVTIINSGQKEIIGEIQYLDLNTLVVAFDYSLTGKVICN